MLSHKAKERALLRPENGLRLELPLETLTSSSWPFIQQNLLRDSVPQIQGLGREFLELSVCSCMSLGTQILRLTLDVGASESPSQAPLLLRLRLPPSAWL